MTYFDLGQFSALVEDMEGMYFEKIHVSRQKSNKL